MAVTVDTTLTGGGGAVTVNYISAVGGETLERFAAVTGPVFNISGAPVAAVTKAWFNGVLQELAGNFTVVGNSITANISLVGVTYVHFAFLR